MIQKTKNVKVAFAAIIEGVKKEAVPFARLLSNVSPYVDGLFITITHKKGEEPDEEVVKVAKAYNANISYFEWVNDFAKARNFNFSQVPEEYDYIMWGDADDIFTGIEKLKDVLNNNRDIDVFVMYYVYSRDEYGNPDVVHLKTQIVKNDSCVEWVGKLHEDFKENRKVAGKLLPMIKRIHMTDHRRIELASQRNLEIAREDVEKNPNDPRSYWNLGNALKGAGENEKSIEVFEKFIEMSSSEEEQYIAYLRIAENYWALGKPKEAIKSARYAIGIRPEYPDAYILLGELFRIKEDYVNAVKMYKEGLKKEPPYHSIIVYNPRQYDYIPMIGLAKSYFMLKLPQLALPMIEGCLKIYPEDKNLQKIAKLIREKAEEADKVFKKAKELSKIKNKKKLKEEIDKLPEDFKNHPAIIKLKNQKLVKTKASGKDIAIFCGYTEKEWTPETAKKEGIGGSEEAVIHLAKRWAKAGWNVEVYNNCGHKDQTFDGVIYKPFYSWNPKDKQNVVILWRTPMMAKYEINADKVFVDLHDVIPDGEFTKERLSRIDKVFVKSNFHKSLFPSIPEEKFVVVPNGIEPEVFKKNLKRDQFLIINTSSPDRSLSAAIQLFRRIKKLVPKAKMKWAYGFGVFDTVFSGDAEKMSWKDDIIKQMEEAGIENLGMISHDEVAKLYLTANVFFYPSEFAEIDCISLTKAMAGGAIPVTTDFSAMGEKAKYGFFFHSDKTKDNWCKVGQFDFSVEDNSIKDKMVKSVVELLKNPPAEEDREEMRDWARKNYDWDKIANKWLEEMK